MRDRKLAPVLTYLPLYVAYIFWVESVTQVRGDDALVLSGVQKALVEPLVTPPKPRRPSPG